MNQACDKCRRPCIDTTCCNGKLCLACRDPQVLITCPSCKSVLYARDLAKLGGFAAVWGEHRQNQLVELELQKRDAYVAFLERLNNTPPINHDLIYTEMARNLGYEAAFFHEKANGFWMRISRRVQFLPLPTAFGEISRHASAICELMRKLEPQQAAVTKETMGTIVFLVKKCSDMLYDFGTITELVKARINASTDYAVGASSINEYKKKLVLFDRQAQLLLICRHYNIFFVQMCSQFMRSVKEQAHIPKFLENMKGTSEYLHKNAREQGLYFRAEMGQFYVLVAAVNRAIEKFRK